MPAWQRTYFIACSAFIGFAIAYVLCDYGAWPKLTYFPYERVWAVVPPPPGEAPMGYVGMLLWGTGGGLVGAALAALATRWRSRAVAQRWLVLIGAWALAAFVYGGLYFTWSLWPF